MRRLWLLPVVSGAFVCLVAAAAPASAQPARSLSATLRASGAVLLGVSPPIERRLAAFDGFGATVGKRAGLANFYVSFASAKFDTALADEVRLRGAVPMVTWLPCRDGNLGPRQPEFSLRRINSGAFDEFIRVWARDVSAWKHPLLLRFAPEMNGSWNPWSAGVNGNDTREYVRAWKRIHDIFGSVGATNVEWVWSPNVVSAGSPSLAKLYPGDAYVDWVGIDGYNWGTSQPRTRWQTFADVFGPTLAEVRKLTKRPIMLAEVGSAERGGNKATWIRDFFRELGRNRDILAFVWFQFDKETDWRVDSSAASARAFTAGVASARVRGAALAR